MRANPWMLAGRRDAGAAAEFIRKTPPRAQATRPRNSAIHARVGGWSGASGFVEAGLDGEVAVLRLTRPETLNALSIPMLVDLGNALRRFGDGEACRGLVLTGTGRAFSAGDDLPATDDLQASDFEELIERFQELTRLVLSSAVPIVAALNGMRPPRAEVEAAIAREDEAARAAWSSGAPREGIRRFLAEREARRSS